MPQYTRHASNEEGSQRGTCEQQFRAARNQARRRACPRPRIDPKEEEDDEYNYNDGDADTLGYRAEYGTRNFSASIKVDGKPAGPFHLPIHSIYPFIAAPPL